MLIVLEGLDGSGKSTQVNKLKEYLEKRNDKFRYIHFPRYDAPVYGDLISSFLRGEFGSIDEVHPKLVALLYAEDRHGAAPLIRKTLDEGGDVLLDRYVYSNIAYQCAKVKDQKEREELRKWIIDTEYGAFSLPKPDLNIFLDVPLSFVRKELEASRRGKDREYLHGLQDVHEADIEFQKRVRDIYLRQTEMDPKFVIIDCTDEFGEMLPPDDIFGIIRNTVEEYLR